MTTIAWDGRTLAADSRATESDGSARTDRFVKLFRIGDCRVHPVQGPVLFAASGCEFAGEMFRRWLERGGEPDLVARGVTDDPEGDSPIDCLIVHASGAYTANHLGILIKVSDRHWAHGTGRQAALAAMLCGRDARYAVWVASQFDNNTGGRIRSMTLDEPPPRRALKRGSRR